MRKIGITGGIGSGKTTVCKVFETLGVPVFYADVVAKEVMTQDPLLVKAVKEAFGIKSYMESGDLNRQYIANIVFNDTNALNKLNALVHPAVFRAFDHWVGTLDLDPPYILKEAALLFESGSYKMCDQNVLVTSPLDTKLRRVMFRDGSTAEQVKARMDKQFSDEQKLTLSDHVILNDDKQSLILQIMDLHQRFLTA